MANIYSLQESELPGNWNYRGDYVWRNTETNELLVIRESTMRQIDDREDSYRVSIHKETGVDTILDNQPKDRCKEIAESYIEDGEVPEESWMHDGGEE